MVESHINSTELHHKIITLFEYRLFPELLALAQDFSEESKADLWEKLFSLQTAIYHLDAHLEANWETNDEILALHWENIGQGLSRLEIPIDSHHIYLNHIRKYEKHELELRQDKSPLRFAMEYFYFYKSCDVKLLRRLIYEKLKLKDVVGSLADWRYYDLITEVNDDVEDVFEDLQFINGNRMLLSIYNKGKDKTRLEFLTFIEQIKEKSRLKYKSSSKSKMHKLIYDITNQRIEETILLLEKNIREIKESDLSSARIVEFVTPVKL